MKVWAELIILLVRSYFEIRASIYSGKEEHARRVKERLAAAREAWRSRNLGHAADILSGRMPIPEDHADSGN